VRVGAASSKRYRRPLSAALPETPLTPPGPGAPHMAAKNTERGSVVSTYEKTVGLPDAPRLP
jgi:hypothetical protein